MSSCAKRDTFEAVHDGCLHDVAADRRSSPSPSTSIETMSVCQAAESGNPTTTIAARTASRIAGVLSTPNIEKTTESGNVAPYNTQTGAKRGKLSGRSIGFQTASYRLSESAVRARRNTPNNASTIPTAGRDGSRSHCWRRVPSQRVCSPRTAVVLLATTYAPMRTLASETTPKGVAWKHNGPQYCPPWKRTNEVGSATIRNGSITLRRGERRAIQVVRWRTRSVCVISRQTGVSCSRVGVIELFLRDCLPQPSTNQLLDSVCISTVWWLVRQS